MTDQQQNPQPPDQPTDAPKPGFSNVEPGSPAAPLDSPELKRDRERQQGQVSPELQRDREQRDREQRERDREQRPATDAPPSPPPY